MRPSRLATAVLVGAMAFVAAAGARVLALVADLAGRHVPRGELLPAIVLLAVLLGVEAGLLLALRARPGLRANLALATVSGLVAVYATEVVLGLGEPAWRARREKLRRIESLRAAGIDAYPGVDPVHFVRVGSAEAAARWVVVGGVPTMPLSGISRRRTVDCREAGEWLEYDSDEQGFHNPPGLWARPGLDLAFVGDSFVHGSCVPSDMNLVAWARRRVPAALNLGTAGSGPLAMLGAVREYLPFVRPRTVVWCYFGGNDLLDLRGERRHPILRRYLEPGFTQDLFHRRAALDAGLREFTEAVSMPLLARGARPRLRLRQVATLAALRSRLGLAFADPSGLAPTEEEYALFASILDEARRTAAGWGGRLVVAYLPGWPEPPRQLGEAEYARQKAAAGRRARAIVTGLGIPLVDVEARFAADPDPLALYACPGCHYSPRGYELAARAILDALAEEAH